MANASQTAGLALNGNHAAPSSPAEPAMLGPDGQPLSKQQIKKEQKRMAGQAAKEAKAKAKAAAPTSSASKPKKEKAAAVEEQKFVNKTKKGEKKDLSGEMASGYNPPAVEAAWNDWWQASGFFKPALTAQGEIKPEGVFIIPAPPPNVTGSLHIGHALTIAIQDALIRWNRMLGKTVLFNPGFDHAGISTQSVVESRLRRLDPPQSRHDLGRDAFIEKVWAWKEDYQARITSQLDRLGASYDWDRTAFTMDPQRSKAVAEAWVQLYDQGIIYRANRLVNWCTYLNTTLSNEEVDKKEIKGRTLLNIVGYPKEERIEFGVLTEFAYPLVGDSTQRIIVATTRPETLFGDTAVAIHPDDKRYTHLHGKFLQHPFLDRQLPIVCDAESADMSFGTGAVKITPAHDENDFRTAERNKLEMINIFTEDGKLNASCGPDWAGIPRFTARRKVIDALKEKGLYVGMKDNPMVVPICSKSGDIIEPLLKPQWWVSCKAMAQEAIKRTRAGELKITPKTSEGEWYTWLEKLDDWCISRQLWWGHRAPAYFVDIEGKDQDSADGSHWVAGRNLEEAQERAAEKFNGQRYTLRQDEDVLDTWFSSGLWPFAIMGWPDKTADMERFYPSTVLETGWDILFFWVARMVLLGLKLTGQMPFREVFCHAMIRDAHGRKMSKSKGNVIDPVDVIESITLEGLHQRLLEGNIADPKELAMAKDGQKKDFPKGIPQCGTDALRFALCNYTGSGRDINLEISKVEGFRFFANKLWNATRFAMLKLDGDFAPAATPNPTGKESLAERYILDRLLHAATEVNRELTDRDFMSATRAIYHFWWDELCAVYIEAMKPMMDDSATAEQRLSAQNTLYTCLDLGFRLLHPFMPYVTEELWQRLPRRPNDATPSICIAAFPTADTIATMSAPSAVADFETVKSCIDNVRSLAGSAGIATNINAFVVIPAGRLHDEISGQANIMTSLIKGCTSLKVLASAAELPEGCNSGAVTDTVSAHVLVKASLMPLNVV
ncbi:uncharacterized protein L969DRAFT_88477 [Mixia osmundae IAM 14324]|uniref:uncharacterized protein n=1 Tax=Mixia osmundae (strain CBS 9802 / IAM 14324 / JCM 22182 / KY 12970) TaxID=764103 RepID=UPI0004A554C5|nr:uncharacterized protein L969DRAFT_88477 [Mixia osmundae IAM 14324]KEI39059.1 hypothetical protein L969DRAFT_88477 [Mixia osmundae IAM 14324]